MGGKTSNSSSQVQIPKDVLQRYRAVNNFAEQVASQPFQQYSQDPNAFVAPLTGTQQAGIQNVNAAQGITDPYFQGAGSALTSGAQAALPLYDSANENIQGGLAGAAPYQGMATGLGLAGARAVNPGEVDSAAINKYMSPYLSNVVDTTMANLRQQQQQEQSSILGSQIGAGAFGGDRGRLAQANLARQQGLASGQVVSGLLNQGYGQALATAQQQQGVGLGAEQANRAAQAQAAGQLSQIGQQGFERNITAAQAQQGLGQGLYGIGAGVSQGLQGLGAAEQNAALTQAQAQLSAGTAEQQTQQAGLSALYNQFLQQQGYPFQTAQFLGNIAMGTGALSGSGTTQQQPSSWFSDERLKDDIEPIGETFDGQKIVKFNYKGSPRKQIGLVAQDVEKHHPEAVGLAGGFKTVDYDAATKDAASMGGVVTPFRAGAGYASGGGVDDDDAIARLERVIAAQREAVPYGSHGLYGQPDERKGPYKTTVIELAGRRGSPIAPTRIEIRPLDYAANQPAGIQQYANGGLVTGYAGGGAAQSSLPWYAYLPGGLMLTALGKHADEMHELVEGANRETFVPQPAGQVRGDIAGRVSGRDREYYAPGSISKVARADGGLVRDVKDAAVGMGAGAAMGGINGAAGVAAGARGGLVSAVAAAAARRLFPKNPEAAEVFAQGLTMGVPLGIPAMLGGALEMTGLGRGDREFAPTPDGDGESTEYARGGRAGLAGGGIADLYAAAPWSTGKGIDIPYDTKHYELVRPEKMDDPEAAARADREMAGKTAVGIASAYFGGGKASGGRAGKADGGLSFGDLRPEDFQAPTITPEDFDRITQGVTQGVVPTPTKAEAVMQALPKDAPQRPAAIPTDRVNAAPLPTDKWRANARAGIDAVNRLLAPIRERAHEQESRKRAEALGLPYYPPPRQKPEAPAQAPSAGLPAGLVGGADAAAQLSRVTPSIAQVPSYQDGYGGNVEGWDASANARGLGVTAARNNDTGRDIAAEIIPPNAAPEFTAPAGLAPAPSAAPAGSAPAAPLTGLAKKRAEMFPTTESWLVPLLTGLGTMASSPSRYAGAAALQGIGGAAGAYENVMKNVAERGAKTAEAESAYADIAKTAFEETTSGIPFVRVYDQDGSPRIIRQPPAAEWSKYTFAPPKTPAERLEMQQQAEAALGAAPTARAATAAKPAGAIYDANTALPDTTHQLLTANKSALENAGLSPESAETSPFKAAADEAEFALGNRTNLNRMAEALSASPAGPAQERLADVARYVNSVTGLFGIPPIAAETLANQEEVDKLRGLLANQARRGSASALELETVLQSIPGNINSEGGKAKIMAGLLTVNQRAVDENNYLNKVKNELAAPDGPYQLSQKQANVAGRGLFQEFTKTQGPRYDEEKRAFEDLFRAGSSARGGDGRQMTALEAIIARQGAGYTPEFRSSLQGYLQSRGFSDPTMADRLLRYFGG